MGQNGRRSPQLKTILCLVSVSIVVLSIALSVFFSYHLFKRVMTERVAASRSDVLLQIQERVSAIRKNALLLANLYYYNENISQSYDGMSFSEEDVRAIRQNFQELEFISKETKEAAGITFYYEMVLQNGYSYYSYTYGLPETTQSYEGALWYPAVVEAKGEVVWLSTHYNEYSGEYVISLARSLVDTEGRHIGVFLLHIPESNFYDTYANLVDGNEIYIVDSKGRILSHSNKDMLGINFYDIEVLNDMFRTEDFRTIYKNQIPYLFSVSREEPQGWLYVEEIALSVLLQSLSSIRASMLFIGAAILLGSIVVCVYIATLTTRPLEALVQELQQVGKTHMTNHSFRVSGWREMDTICEECNHMTSRISTLVQDIKQSEKRKRTAEMGFMQAQMSPHFLYNTLFSIRCLVDMNERPRAIGIIDAFTAILKYILAYRDEFSQVSEEIELLENYAKMQQYRYGDGFSLRITCDKTLYSAKILRMILEPLVENSLFHGKRQDGTPLRIEVDFSKGERDLHITVTDNGVGFNEENLEQLSQRIQMGGRSNMIGINNIRDRIRLYFGEEYGISIDTDFADGARIEIKLPLVE